MEAYVGRILFVVLLIGVYTASAYPSERALEEELREYLAEKEDERGFDNFAPDTEDEDSDSIERNYIARLLEEKAAEDPAMQSFDEMDEDEDDGLERELPSFDMPVDEGENMIPDFEQEEYLRNANDDGDFKDAFDEESFFNNQNRDLDNDFNEGEEFEEQYARDNNVNDEVNDEFQNEHIWENDFNDAEQEYMRRNDFDEDDSDEEEMSDFQRQEYQRMANEQADRLNDEYMQKKGGFDDWEQDQRNINDDDDEPDDNGFTEDDRALLEQLVQTIKTEKAEGATDEEIEKELETLGSL